MQYKRIVQIISGLSLSGAEVVLNLLLIEADKAQFKHFLISLTNGGGVGETTAQASIAKPRVRRTCSVTTHEIQA